MNKEILRNYWKKPHSVDLTHLNELYRLCEEYPFAVGLKQLYCKALIVHQDLNFEKVLKLTAIQTAQRGTLRSWLINDFHSNDKYLYPLLPAVEEEEEEDFTSVKEIKEEVQTIHSNHESVLKIVSEDKEFPNENNVVSELSPVANLSIEENTEQKIDNTISEKQSINLIENKPISKEETHENEVKWEDIKPIQLTLLPVPEVAKDKEQFNELRTVEDTIVSQEIKGNLNEVREVIDEVSVEQNEFILIDNEVINYDKNNESDVLDQQILNAAILGSSYQISEGDNLKEKTIGKNKTTFVDWFDRIEKGDLNDEEIEFRKKAEKIIDQFLAKQPKIKIKKEFYSADNYVKKGSEENDDIISETLIKIYIQQGHVQKAIDGYSKLALKFPEKSKYFQSEIEKLK